jgi:hypothetical protein
MHKRGQFFLAASLVIITILISFGTVYNSISASSFDPGVSDLAKEIKYESAQVIDYSIKNHKDAEVNQNLENLLTNYSQSNKDKKFITVYGRYQDSGDYSLLRKDYENGQALGSSQSVTLDSGGKVAITEEGYQYFYSPTKGQNLYVIVIKEVGDERFVSAA